jgi:large subunit ribosomal protein L32e
MTKKFIRKDVNKKKRIANTGWRKPKGITNKMRLNKKGHSANVRPGYGTKDTERNKISGLQIITVRNIFELEQINPKTQCVVIARVGKQNKLNMIKYAEEKKIIINNLKVEKYKELTTNFFVQREKASKQKTEKQKAKEEDLKKIEKKKEDKKQEKEVKDAKDEISEEEKQKQEKLEREKILTKNK